MDKDRIKVTTSCSGRFWVYDQAFQLNRMGVLEKIINDYPKFKTREWGIPDEKVVSLVLNGVLNRVVQRVGAHLSDNVSDILHRAAHRMFAARLARMTPPRSDVFIGLSSFCLEAVREAKSRGIFTVVDHGSAHQAYERRILSEENLRLSISDSRDLPPPWIIEREQKEFLEADMVMVLSSYAKRTLQEYGVPAEKIFVNRCGVDISQFYPEKKTDNTFRVIQVGGIHVRKGVHYTLEAFTELAHSDSELWFVGSGYERTALRKIIDKNLPHNVFFKGGVPQRDLRRLYCQSDVFVLSSLSDGFGMVVTQAMACGLPVIVTENVGASDLVEDGVTGFVIPIRDVSALRDCILRLKKDPDLRIKMGENARRKITNGNTWEEYGIRLVDELENRLGRN